MGSFVGVDRNYMWGGGVPPVSEREISVEFEAGALQNRAAADIATQSDALDAYILKGMPYGRERSEPNKPTLEFPFISLRTSTGRQEEQESGAKAILKRLIAQLPPEVKAQLEKELQEPETKRNPAYAALANSLQYAAQGLLLLDAAGRSFNEESLVLCNAQKNVEFTGLALAQLIAEGQQLLRESYLALKNKGANHPHFDALLKHFKNSAAALGLLKRLFDQENGQKEEEKNRKGKKKKRRKESLKRSLERIVLYGKHYDAAFDGEGLLMIRPLFHAMSEIGCAHALNAGQRSLLFGLFVYNIGIGEEPSATSPIGKGLNRAIDRLFAILGDATLNRFDPRTEAFFPLSAKLFLILAVTASLCLITSRSHRQTLGGTAEEEKQKYLSQNEQKVVNSYALWNLMAMSLQSGLLKKVIPKEMLAAEYGGQNSLTCVVEMLEFTILCMAIRAVKQVDEEASTLLLQGLAQKMVQRGKTLEEAIYRLGSSREGNVNTLLIPLMNCRISLEREQYSEWVMQWDEVLIALGMEKGEIEGEIKKLGSHALLWQSLLMEHPEEFAPAVTGIIQI